MSKSLLMVKSEIENGPLRRDGYATLRHLAWHVAICWDSWGSKDDGFQTCPHLETAWETNQKPRMPAQPQKAGFPWSGKWLGFWRFWKVPGDSNMETSWGRRKGLVLNARNFPTGTIRGWSRWASLKSPQVWGPTLGAHGRKTRLGYYRKRAGICGWKSWEAPSFLLVTTLSLDEPVRDGGYLAPGLGQQGSRMQWAHCSHVSGGWAHEKARLSQGADRLFVWSTLCYTPEEKGERGMEAAYIAPASTCLIDSL